MGTTDTMDSEGEADEDHGDGAPITEAEMDEIKNGMKQEKDAQAKTLVHVITELGSGTNEEKERGLVLLIQGLKGNENGALAKSSMGV